jgi:hypothetical protein
MMADWDNGVERINRSLEKREGGAQRQFLRLLNDPPLRER